MTYGNFQRLSDEQRIEILDLMSADEIRKVVGEWLGRPPTDPQIADFLSRARARRKAYETVFDAATVDQYTRKGVIPPAEEFRTVIAVGASEAARDFVSISSTPLPTSPPAIDARRRPPTVTPSPTPSPTPTATPWSDPVGELARVLHVIDGDTIDVRVNGYRERVRLLKVDTPERGCPLFDTATAFVRERVSGKQVVLNFPSGTPEWDVYGRLLAEVQFQRGGRVLDLGSELLDAGLAVPYVPGGPDCLPPG